jgi:hypothetical protein
MRVLTIEHPAEQDTAANTTPTTTGTATTPTFVSTESLTFPGISLISLGLVQIWAATTGHAASPHEILLIASVLGGSLIVYGLLNVEGQTRRLRDIVGQLIIGVLNTVVLYGVMLGVTA